MLDRESTVSWLESLAEEERAAAATIALQALAAGSPPEALALDDPLRERLERAAAGKVGEVPQPH